MEERKFRNSWRVMCYEYKKDENGKYTVCLVPGAFISLTSFGSIEAAERGIEKYVVPNVRRFYTIIKTYMLY